MSRIQSINALTLATHDMARSVAFYEAIGFLREYGGPSSSFTTFRIGADALNIIAVEADKQWAWWGRAIFWVDDVDAVYRTVLTAGFSPEFAPRDATWGERYFHLTDPDGHELSFAKPLSNKTGGS